MNKNKKMVSLDQIKVSLVKGECYWTLIRFGYDRAAMLTPVEVEKLIKELEATIS